MSMNDVVLVIMVFGIVIGIIAFIKVVTHETKDEMKEPPWKTDYDEMLRKQNEKELLEQEEKKKKRVCDYCGTPWGRFDPDVDNSCKKCGAPMPWDLVDNQPRWKPSDMRYPNPLSGPRYTVACTTAEYYSEFSTTAEIEEMGDG